MKNINTTANLINNRYAVIAIESDYVMGVFDGGDEAEAIRACLLDAGVTPGTEEWEKHAADLRAEAVYSTPEVTLYDKHGEPYAGIEGDEYGLMINVYDANEQNWYPASEYIPALLGFYEAYTEYRSEADEDDRAYVEELDESLDTIRHALEIFGVTATEGKE